MADEQSKTESEILVEKKTPHDLVQEVDVAIALKNDKGQDATLKSFEIKDFTKKGDNYACVITSVVVTYVDAGKDENVTYVVKLNPCRSEDFEAISTVLFEKEIGFYTTLLPLLNSELSRADEKKLRVPTCYHYVNTANDEVIYLEDLRQLGYKMLDRKKGLDKEHTELILTELGRFHAASSLLMSRGEFQGEDIFNKLPILIEAFDGMNDENSKFNFKTYLPMLMDMAKHIAMRSEGYEKLVPYFSDKRELAADMLMEQFNVTDQFKVICHGDCWNNNFLFR